MMQQQQHLCTMQQCMFDEKDAVGVAMVLMTADLATSLLRKTTELKSVRECLPFIRPLLNCQRIRECHIIQLICKLHYSKKQVQEGKALQLCSNCLRMLTECWSPLETMSVMTITALQNPRFKAQWSLQLNQCSSCSTTSELTARCAII